MNAFQKELCAIFRETGHLDGCLQAINISVSYDDEELLVIQLDRLNHHHPEVGARLMKAYQETKQCKRSIFGSIK